MSKKVLLVLGPSFRRRRTDTVLSALDRFDGLFFRVAKKHLDNGKGVDVVVMQDDLTLIEGVAPLPYIPPTGSKWAIQTLQEKTLEKGRAKNEVFLNRKLKGEKYSEVFIAMGKKYAKALPELSKYNVNVVFPTCGGPGPKAKALKEWLCKVKGSRVAACHRARQR